MKRNIVSFSIPFILSFMVLGANIMAQATSTTTVETIPLSGTLLACNGEPVDFDGAGRVVFHINTSNAGRVNIHGSGTTNISAVGGITGAKYIARETYSFGERFDVDEPAPYNMTIVDNYTLIGKGVPNLKLHVLIRTVINANGELTSSKFVFDVDCNP